jgi:hypothetical protein
MAERTKPAGNISGWRDICRFGRHPDFVVGSRLLEFIFSGTGGRASQLIEAPFGQGYQLAGVSVFWMMRSFGTGIVSAYICQAIAGLLAIFLVYRVWLVKNPDRLAQVAFTLCVSLFVTPYGFSADMVGYSVALVSLAYRRRWKVSLMDGLLWLWPGYAPVVTGVSGRLLTPFAVGMVAAMAWRQLRLPEISHADHLA